MTNTDKLAKFLAEIKVQKVNWKNETVLIPTEWPIDVNEIAAIIADAIEDFDRNNDEKYTEHFLEWRTKYFTEKKETTHFLSKSTKQRISDRELELNYRRAMRKNALK